MSCQFVILIDLADDGLQVQTDDQAGTQGGNREKDPRSLSGGEKSFSTICLLLSLWESIGCPIRCLGTYPNLSRRSRLLTLVPPQMSSMSSWTLLTDVSV